MDELKSTLRVAVGLMVLGSAGAGHAQAPAAAKTAPAKAPAPLKLQSLDAQTQADPFPAVNPKYFTADSPSVATVDSYLHAMLGYDVNRIWRVEGIEKTAVPNVTRVRVLISERSPNAKVSQALFYVMPDGKRLIAGDSMNPFGANPFAENRALLQARADGPSHGASSKDLLIVEFADLQCPHCKDAQATMAKLAADFPKARIVYESFPLTEIHPYAFQAAAYGACIAKTSSDAFFTYAQAVYDTQGALLPDTVDETLKNAVTKAGMDPAAIAACAATDEAKASVNASMKLATDLGVDSTPMLSVNGRMLLPNGIPYETLKQLVVFQAGLDGVAAAATSPNGVGLDTKR